MQASGQHPDERRLPGPVFSEHHDDLGIRELSGQHGQLEVAWTHRRSHRERGGGGGGGGGGWWEGAIWGEQPGIIGP